MTNLQRTFKTGIFENENHGNFTRLTKKQNFEAVFLKLETVRELKIDKNETYIVRNKSTAFSDFYAGPHYTIHTQTFNLTKNCLNLL
jgi:hypothetical protein